MKKNMLSALLVFISTICFAQTVSVSGTVTDQQGKPVPFAFVRDSQHPSATYSDLNGAFSLMADPASKLIATSIYLPKTEVKIDNPSDTKIVMPGILSDKALAVAAGTKNAFSNNEGIQDMAVSGDRMGAGAHQEDVHGSKFLFNNWVHGFAVSDKDSIRQNDIYLFNYDKIDGNLIFTKDKNNVFLGTKQDIKSFTLFDDNAQPFAFEQVPAIDSKHYMLVIASGSKYKIYKDFGTRFVKADFQTNGIASSGNKYDEYLNDSVYYIAKLPGGTPQKLELRKKSIKAAFVADAAKTNKFLADNDADIDENYLKKLVDYVSQ
jgi:hypothetical protein